MDNEPKYVRDAKKGGVYVNGCWYQPQEYALVSVPAPEKEPRKIGFQYPGKES